jgi:hypothetical protein
MPEPPTTNERTPLPSALPARLAAIRAAEAEARREIATLEATIAELERRDGPLGEREIAQKREAEKRRAELYVAVQRLRERHEERLRLRRLRLGVAGAAFVGAGLLAARLVPTMTAGLAATTSAINEAAAPFQSSGFVELRTVWGVQPTEIPTTKGTCYVAVGAAADGPPTVHVQRGFATVEGRGSVGFCACDGSPVKIKAAGKEPLALRVLTSPAAAIGGADLFPQQKPRPVTILPETVDRACAEDAIDQFVASRPRRHAPPPSPVTTKLTAFGARSVGVALPEDAFAVIPATAETCFAAVGREGTEGLALRLPGGARPAQAKQGALVFCTKAARGLSVWRAGTGLVDVYAAPAARVGGALGMRDLAERAGAGPVTTWVPEDELAYDAAATLAASGLSPSSYLESSALARAAVIAFSTDARSTAVVDPADPSVVCRPATALGAMQSLCLEARPGAWSPLSGLPAGSLAAQRPSWFPPSGAFDRPRLERMLDVLSFARRMALAGFELATFGGAQPTPTGARITGRSGEKEVVAIALGPQAPWVVPLSDGAPWTLDDQPKAVSLPPGQAVDLVGVPRSAAIGPREILVWRR